MAVPRNFATLRFPASAGMTAFSITYHLRAYANRFAGSKHAQRKPCYTLRRNDGLVEALTICVYASMLANLKRGTVFCHTPSK